MLRATLLLLLLANALFLAWAQGWLAPTWPPPRHNEREPQRLAAQVHPERVQVLAPQAASSALQAAQAAAARAERICLEAGPYGPTDLAETEALLSAAELPEGAWQRVAAADTSDPASAAALLLRVPAADAELQARLLALNLPAPGFRPCATVAAVAAVAAASAASVAASAVEAVAPAR